MRAALFSLLCLLTSAHAATPTPELAPATPPSKPHWAFLPPKRPEVPTKPNASRNPIDAFIETRLRTAGLSPAPPADRATQLRRASLDLTGLPPSAHDQNAYLRDTSPHAYENAVDRMLASPRFGERMAQDWLDVARFADSNGYQVDRDRDLWAWRDWVVRAFNRNLPFDQFTIEQLAGDLLDHPTFDQRVATGFNRNHMINEEGGIIPEEFLAEYCADRVETTATVWLGLTLNCARCHDHKYDPFTQRDYYGLLAFFHNISEQGVGDYEAHYRHGTPPFLKLPAPALEAQLAALKTDLEPVHRAETNLAARVLSQSAEWEILVQKSAPVWQSLNWTSARFESRDPGPPAPDRRDGEVTFLIQNTNTLTLDLQAQIPASPWTCFRIEFDTPAGQEKPGESQIQLSELHLLHTDTNEISLRPRAFAGGTAPEELARSLDRKTNTAWRITLAPNSRIIGVFDTLSPIEASDARTLTVRLKLSGQPSNSLSRVRLQASSTRLDLLPTPSVAKVLDKPDAQRSAEERKQLDDFRLNQSSEYVEKKRLADQLRKRISGIDESIPVTLVMAELAKPRETFILKRGAYDQKLDRVEPNTPVRLPSFPKDAPPNRLGLAKWITDPNHPLTSRVAVNRLWQSFFGDGLVRTPEDFGSQGEPPSHPELLDWLATEYVRTSWNTKALVRLLVTSDAYRRDSRATPKMLAADAENRWMARGPRYRLSAEVIRDQALAIAGSLVDQIGGPPVRPYHPPDLYEQVVAGSSAPTYVQDHGRSLYRRTLYTYWKRSVPNPALLLFDRPFRETCAVKRPRTSTPLQALNLMNDPTYTESARLLAQRMLHLGTNLTDHRIRWGLRTVLAREAADHELEALRTGLNKMRRSFRSDPKSALQLISVGESKPDASLDTVELAAYTMLATTLLNLDETITKE